MSSVPDDINHTPLRIETFAQSKAAPRSPISFPANGLLRSGQSLISFDDSSGSVVFKDNRSIASSSSRPVLSYVTHYSDSGFSSTLSTGSSCSYLPPPPPYRMRGSGKAQRIHRSLSDSKYGTTSHGHMIALPSIRTGGSAHFFQDLQKAQRAGSWTPRVSYYCNIVSRLFLKNCICCCNCSAVNVSSVKIVANYSREKAA